MAIGYQIKTVLRSRGMTIKHLAELIGVPTNTLYSITKRDSNRVDPVILQRIAQALNVTVDCLRGKEPIHIQVSKEFEDDGGKLAHFIRPLVSLPDDIDPEGVVTCPVLNDCMNGARIHAGDIVAVDRRARLEDGDIALVKLNGQESYRLGRYYRSGEAITLVPQSTDPEFRPEAYLRSEVTVVGKVVFVGISV